MAGEQKDKIYIVRAKDGGASQFIRNGETADYRIVRAKRLPQVEAHIAKEFEIAIASTEDLYNAGSQGVAIEEAAE